MKIPLVGRADLLRALKAGVSPDFAAGLCGYERVAPPETPPPPAVSREKPPEPWEELPSPADKPYTKS